jgi:hypothetical protein
MNTARRTALKYFPVSNIRSAEILQSALVRKYKIAVFVPSKNADELTFRMALKGAGSIGNYTVCSFRSEGHGTCLGGIASKPVAGKRGKFEIVEEIRLEMICEEDYLGAVLDEIYRTHPYEEPACEVYEVLVRDKKISSMITEVILRKSVTPASVLMKINSRISKQGLSLGVRKTKIRRFILNNSGIDEVYYPAARMKTMYISRKKKEIKIEIL